MGQWVPDVHLGARQHVLKPSFGCFCKGCRVVASLPVLTRHPSVLWTRCRDEWRAGPECSVQSLPFKVVFFHPSTPALCCQK